MDEYEHTTVMAFLEHVQKRIKTNTDNTLKNLETISLILSSYQSSAKRDKIIGKILAQNEFLRSESANLLKLYNTLFGFYDRYTEIMRLSRENEFIAEIKSIQSWETYRNTCLERFINGELDLRSNHPLLSDSGFLSELMQLCQSLEKYEMCNAIQQIRHFENQKTE